MPNKNRNDTHVENEFRTHHSQSMSGSSSTQEIQLSELLATIMESWQLIVTMIILFLFIGLLYVTVVTPIYQADVLLQVEDKNKGVGALADLSVLLQEESPVTAEFEIIRSRMVLGSVVENLKLDIVAHPVYFPLIGALLARQNSTETDAHDSWYNIKPYAWGNERIQVDSFDVPMEFEGETFTLEALEQGRYRLYDPEGQALFEGAVGKLANFTPENGGAIKLFVSDLRSEAGTHFELIKKAKLAAIGGLKLALKIAELGKQSGVIQMNLEGQNRNRITDILNEIANIYLRQSVERKSFEAEKTLLFLNKQLPLLKDKLDAAEAELNNYRLKKGSVDLPKETQGTLDKAVSLDAQLTQLKQEREELTRRFTPQHPRIAAIDAQIATLDSELSKVESRVKGLPGTQQEILRLTRNAQVNATLYTSLLNSAQELKVVKAGAVGNVRIVDYAIIPDKPVKPKKALVIALMLVLGVLLGVGAAILRKSLSGAVQDPDLIEKKLGLLVLATVPHSSKQKELKYGGRQDVPSAAVLAANSPEDLAVESLRSLRTSLYFAQLNTRNNVISITSPGPGAGKSFIAVNLATVLAGADKQVLLIDADMRKGRLKSLFGFDAEDGLSNAIAGEVEFAKVIQKTDINNLDVITAGTIPPNPSELLMHRNFAMAIEIVSENYDHVIIDSPPVLAVTDAAIIGRMSGATLLVVKDNQSPLREIEQSVKRLKQAGANLRGAVYNGMRVSTSRSRYGYGKYYGYGYSYSHKKKDKKGSFV